MYMKLEELRSLMRMRGIDIYYIPTADFHESEYVIDYFKARAYMTGFTGSAGMAVVTMTKAGLWTDGRYFIQAAKQLQGSGFELYRIGVEGVPSVREFIASELLEGGCIGFDGRVVNAKDGEAFLEIAEKKQGRLETGEDLVDQIWHERPQLVSGPAFYLDECYTGETPLSKLNRIRTEMDKCKADYHLISSLDDVMWVLNVRGCDVPHFPVILSYLAVTKKDAVWFVDKNCLDETICAKMEESGVRIAPYSGIYGYAAEIPSNSTVMIDKSTVSYRITKSLSADMAVIDAENPAMIMKAVKNSVEIENIRKAHILDGVAFTRFMYWVKNNVGKIKMTEISASDYLESMRAEQEGFKEISFATISAYQENAAMMHYCATPDHNAKLEPYGFLLVDSGGHYMTGSTDITRTIALGKLTEEQKQHFTLVAKGNLNLANAKFLYGCTGINLDILSRGPLWQLGIDYQCGTGHGVGYMLSIHEKPNGIRWKYRPASNCVMEAGMVTSDEPGVYLEGKYGIRTENELLCVKAEKNFYGQFMQFENLTYAPIDLDAIDIRYLSEDDRRQLNEYHENVYQVLSPYLSEEEKIWLRKYTRTV